MSKKLKGFYEAVLQVAGNELQEMSAEVQENLLAGLVPTSEDAEDIREVSQVAGLAMRGIAASGGVLSEVAGKPQLLCAKAGEKSYTLARSFVEEGEDTIPVRTEAKAQKEALVQVSTPAPIPTPDPEPVFAKVPEEPTVAEPEPVKEPEPAPEPMVVESEPIEAEASAEEPAEVPVQEEPEEVPEPFVQAPEEPAPARQVPEEREEAPFVQVAPTSMSGFVAEEKSKHADDFVFDLYRITVAHGEYGGPSKPEEMIVMVAPLKLQRFGTPSVPIIVTIFYKGRAYTKSSYDAKDGKSLVQIDVNEYYLLVRGSFDDAGAFRSVISTTGISSNQGDRINVSSLEHHGRPKAPGCGHLKFTFGTETGTGVVEVFPVSLEENDFIVCSRAGEFTDYFHLSDAGMRTALIRGEGGRKNEVVVMWNGDVLEGEVSEV